MKAGISTRRSTVERSLISKLLWRDLEQFEVLFARLRQHEFAEWLDYFGKASSSDLIVHHRLEPVSQALSKVGAMT